MEKAGWTTNYVDDVGISAHLLAKQYDIWSFFVCSERSSPYLNDIVWCALFVIQAFEFDFILENIEFSSLLFSFEHCKFLFVFSTYIFGNITFYINLPNVTLSNMSHLENITLVGETDGVTLSRLECTWPCRHVQLLWVVYTWDYILLSNWTGRVA